jgi:signal transduction histidine kinase
MLRDTQAQPLYLIAMLEDITDQKALETEVAELNRRMFVGREKDRLLLSQELHDGPVQDLYGLSFHLKAFADHLPEEIERAPVAQLQSALHQVVNTLRTICSELRPPTLAPFGLEKAIRSHAASFVDTHPELYIQLNLMPDGQELPETVRLALFRIYQQAMTNILRHAGARNVLVHFSRDHQQLILAIQDDGVGFEVPDRWIDLARNGHLGLAGAAERASSIGGEFMIDSAPGKGTLLRVVVPFEIDASWDGRSRNETGVHSLSL